MTPSEQSYREIFLSHGQVALVDAADYDWLSQWKWRAIWNKNTRSYYAVSTQIISGRRRLVRMHRLVLGLDFGDPRQSDHIVCGETLDNRRSNLRIATARENYRNRRKPTTNKSGFKGVRYISKWIASIRVDGKDIHLGTFNNPIDAHAAYIKAAEKIHGDFSNAG